MFGLASDKYPRKQNSCITKGKTQLMSLFRGKNNTLSLKTSERNHDFLGPRGSLIEPLISSVPPHQQFSFFFSSFSSFSFSFFSSFWPVTPGLLLFLLLLFLLLCCLFLCHCLCRCCRCFFVVIVFVVVVIVVVANDHPEGPSSCK